MLSPFNPEFRYLLNEDEHNGEIKPFIEPHVFAAIYVCVTNIFVVSIALVATYNLFDYVTIGVKHLCSYLWNNMLTHRYKWIDILLIVNSLLTFLCGFVLNCITDVMIEKYIKLKTELKKKEERIKELESQLNINKLKINELNFECEL